MGASIHCKLIKTRLNVNAQIEANTDGKRCPWAGPSLGPHGLRDGVKSKAGKPMEGVRSTLSQPVDPGGFGGYLFIYIYIYIFIYFFIYLFIIIISFISGHSPVSFVFDTRYDM